MSAAAITAATLSAAPDSKPPRIVAAVMQDADGDGRADRVRVTYSERVRHRADRDGRYPFAVAGYAVGSVEGARGRSVVLTLVEQAAADDAARPSLRYRRTNARPVVDRAGNQARAQVFRGVRSHGTRPDGTPPPPPPPPPPDADRDRDGVVDAKDCGPGDPAIKPGAPDAPDLAFVDSNCDGIDGDERKAIFVSRQGRDTNPGTKAAPKRQIQAAVAAAVAASKDVYAAAGAYGRVEVVSGVGIYGGYDHETWKRSLGLDTAITGSPEGILANGDTDVVLQLLAVQGSNTGQRGASAYGIRGINGSKLTLQRVTARADNGAGGAGGASGGPGAAGKPGEAGLHGWCDLTYFDPTNRAPGGAGAFGRDGGSGGYGGYDGSGGGPRRRAR